MPNEAHISFSVRSDQPLVVWMLQLGGWLPLQFTSVGVVLVDKNVLRAIEALAAHPGRQDMSVERWWLSHLNSDRFALNAVLCSHEGDTRRVPTYHEFCASLAQSLETLATGLPKARLVEHRPADLERLYENVTATGERHAKESRFLMSVAQFLHSRVSSLSARHKETELLEAARECGLELRSFVVLCALSCLYEPQDGSEPMIGRKVLKPTRGFCEADAHNALSDLRSLELLALAAGLDGPPIGYCTRDKGLAALWTYLRVSEPQWSGNTFTASVSPASELFPRLDETAVNEMLLRL